MKTPELPASVTQRRAIVYVRQSTAGQVIDNLESQRRQYELVEVARACGFRDVVTIDEDLGRSASGMVSRPGFESLVAQLCQGLVGAVFCLEASRLARNGRDWHHLLELCGLVGARVIDGDGAYDPSLPNDRLLLGLKGTMSEFELTLLRRRLVDGARSKASRGELRMPVPVGYLWTREHGLEMDPDRRTQEAIRTIFSLFDRLGSARKVLLHMRSNELRVPRPVDGKRTSAGVRWELPVYRSVVAALQNPFYAGAYAYGKTDSRTQLSNGRLAKTYGHPRPLAQWSVLLRDHHAGYIDWASFERNQERLCQNAYRKAAGRPKSARGGRALLTGLLRCGHCSRMLKVTYSGHAQLARYACRMGSSMHGLANCISFGAHRPDDAVANELLRVVEPLAIEATVTAARQIEARDQERVRALELECEQARYEVQLASRRYEAVDPGNRLVASELESRWNGAIARLKECEGRLAAAAGAPRAEPDLAALERLARDLPGTWNAAGTSMSIKQRLLRTLVEEIIVKVEVPSREIVFTIHWKGGQHSELRVRRPQSGEHTKRASEAADQIIRDMAGTWSDEHIATTLNRMGLQTGQSRTWNAQRVIAYRSKHEIAGYAPAASPREWVTMRDAAKHAGVSSHFVRSLVARGLLPAKQVMPDAPWQIRLVDLDSDAVRDAIARRHSTGRPREARRDDQTLTIPGLSGGDAQ
jgi:DNA invertase Pin-like site-specific DNA recombinase